MTGLTDAATYQRIRTTANHIVAAGPATTERWEEQSGLSPSSIAAVIAGLVAAADIASLVWRLAICGLGFGFFQSPNNRLIIPRAGCSGSRSAPLWRRSRSGGCPSTLPNWPSQPPPP